MPIETVIFDLGRTLVPFSFAALEPQLIGCRPAAEALFQQAEVGALSGLEFQQGMCGLAGIESGAFGAWWNSIFSPEWLIPPEWIHALLGQRRVGLLSNTNALHYEFLLAKRPLLREFDFQIVSHQVGAAKPDPRIYAAAEAQAECAPENIYYLDDIPEYVAAARARGWQAARFTNFAELRGEWEALGLPRPRS